VRAEPVEVADQRPPEAEEADDDDRDGEGEDRRALRRPDERDPGWIIRSA
jgi:hypothetical protein